jgi:Tol biopolymer transport system component
MKPGDSLAHFIVQEQIGLGGMGAVFRATDTKLSRDVALKVLPEAFAEDAERLARFRREAQVLASLQHPNIASIYGIETAEGQTFLVMELCEGQDLSAIIDRGPVPVEEARDIARQIARGLEEAHEKGIIHRDLKPANVKVSSEGKVKILDFGLARTFTEDAEPAESSNNTMTVAASMTRPGVVLGTAAYMSPEQARGQGIDKRTDIWAFGVILFEMLTGKRLFAGETATDILASVLRQEPDFDSLPEGLPLELGYVIRRCLDRNRESRLRDIGEARCLVSQDASASSLSLLALPAVESTGQVRRSRSVLWPAAVAVLLLALVGALTLGRGPDQAERQAVNMAFTQLTSQGHLEHGGAMGPDGNYFVYTALGGDDFDIFMQRAGGLNPINLTEDSDSFDGQAAVSPDGASIVFTSNREGGGVYHMGATGESARLLAAGGSYPAWSPDGRQIVFSTENFRSPLARETTSQLWIVGVDGRDNQQIPLDLDAIQPSWSPGGQRIAFWSVLHESGQRDIWTVRPDGSELTRITEDSPLDYCPVWSRDGKWLYFLSNRGGLTNLWRVPMDEETGQKLGEPEMFTMPSTNVPRFSLSPDGSRLVFTDLKELRHLYRLDLDPVTRTPLGQPVPLLTGSMIIQNATASSDGQWLAFIRRGFKEDLYLVRSDGTGLRKLTDDVARDRGPQWYDDDRRLIFYSDRSGAYEIWSIRTDGGDARQLTRDSDDAYWFPQAHDNREYVTTFNEYGSFRMDWNADRTALGKPVAMPDCDRPGLKFFSSKWSPDGSRLVGWSAESTTGLESTISIFTPDNGTFRHFAKVGGSYANACWLSDGEIVFRDEHGIHLQDLEQGLDRLILPDADFPGVREVIASPGGNALFLIKGSYDSDLWLAELQPDESTSEAAR